MIKEFKYIKPSKEAQMDRKIIEKAIKDWEFTPQAPSSYLTSSRLCEAERQYIQRKHASEYYKSLSEEGRINYDNELGSMMQVIKNENSRCPPYSEEEMAEVLSREYAEMS